MDTQDELLQYLVDVLEDLQLPYAIVGSVAAMAYGEPRLTRDIDVLVLLPANRVSDMQSWFVPPEFYFNDIAAAAATREGGQFNIIHPSSGYKIDVFVGEDAHHRAQLDRALRVRVLPDAVVSLGSPEDVILSKLDYYRMAESPKHLRDIAGMLQVSGEQIDRERIRAEAGVRGTLHIWQAIIERVDEA